MVSRIHPTELDVTSAPSLRHSEAAGAAAGPRDLEHIVAFALKQKFDASEVTRSTSRSTPGISMSGASSKTVKSSTQSLIIAAALVHYIAAACTGGLTLPRDNEPAALVILSGD